MIQESNASMNDISQTFHRTFTFFPARFSAGGKILSPVQTLLSLIFIHDIFDLWNNYMGLDLRNAGSFYQGNI